MSTSVPPYLSSSPSLFTSAIHLSLASLSLIVSLILVVTESRVNPRTPRLLLSGDATSLPHSSPSDPHEEQQQQQQQQQRQRQTRSTTSRTPNRAKACIAVFRILLALALAANLAFVALSLIPIITSGPISTLASQETNQFAHDLLKKSLVQYSIDNPDARNYASPSVEIGISERLLTPKNGGGGRLLYVILLAVISIISFVGLVLAVLPEKLPVQRAVAVIMFVQAVTWLVGSLVAALVWPTGLPYDATPIVNHWMDRVYVEEQEWVNETRLAGNWFIKVEEQVQPVTDLEGFETSFCTVFTQLVPKTGAEVSDGSPRDTSVSLTEKTISVMHAMEGDSDFWTGKSAPSVAKSAAPATQENPSRHDTLSADLTTADVLATSAVSSTIGSEKWRIEDAPLVRLLEENVNEFFMTYLVGRPSGIHDAFRVLSYVALSAMACAPAAAGQLCKLWVLMPLVLVWAALWLLLVILGTPSVLRVLAAPVENVQEFSVCSLKYRVLVVDKMTRLVAGLDAAFFSVVLLVGLVNGFRWLRFAETTLRNREEKEVRPVSYEDIYSGSGALRW